MTFYKILTKDFTAFCWMLINKDKQIQVRTLKVQVGTNVHKNIVGNWGGLFTFIHKSTIYWILLKHIIIQGKRHMVNVI